MVVSYHLMPVEKNVVQLNSNYT